MKNDTLFNEFPEISAKAWKQNIQFQLKGADYNKTLVWESPEGIKVKPFYHSDDIVGSTGNVPAINHSWAIGQTIYAGHEEQANEHAKKELGRGAEAILFTVPTEKISVKTLFKNLDTKKTPLYFDFQFLSADYIGSIVALPQYNGGKMFMNVDIIGNLARSGNWYFNLKRDHEILNCLLRGSCENVLSVDVSLYENAGANITQQLGYAMAHANEYLNHLSENGLLGQLKNITFKCATGGNYFFEIAKFRALRLLWKTLAEEYGLDIGCHIMAFPSKRNKTLYDYNTNMLRTTTECMSAVLGGANTIFNQPYDAIYHKDNEFSKRISLNQLLLLKEEGYFDKVYNVADGAYYIENLTDQLAEKGLELFKSIEKGGGFLKQLKTHTIQQKIKESAQKQQKRFDAQDEVLVGTNKYINESDKMKDDLELYPFVKQKPRKTLIEPIVERRLAEAIEQKRIGNE